MRIGLVLGLLLGVTVAGCFGESSSQLPTAVGKAISVGSTEIKTGQLVLFSTPTEFWDFEVKWDFGDGTQSNRHSILHSYELPGKYAVTATVYGRDAENSEQLSRNVTVIYEPWIDFNYLGDEVHATARTEGSASPAAGYAWDLEGEPLAGSKDIVFPVPSDASTLTLTVTYKDGSSDEAMRVVHPPFSLTKTNTHLEPQTSHLPTECLNEAKRESVEGRELRELSGEFSIARSADRTADQYSLAMPETESVRGVVRVFWKHGTEFLCESWQSHVWPTEEYNSQREQPYTLAALRLATLEYTACSESEQFYRRCPRAIQMEFYPDDEDYYYASALFNYNVVD